MRECKDGVVPLPTCLVVVRIPLHSEFVEELLDRLRQPIKTVFVL